LTDFSFSYLLVPEITPFQTLFVDRSSTNFLFDNETPPAVTPEELAAIVAERKIAWSQVKSRERNTSEIRLTFQWPLLGGGGVGPKRQSFRAIITGEQKETDGLWMFQPQSFAAVPAP
jgi:hypothetical protein